MYLLFSFILPTVLILSALFSFALMANAVMGLLSKRAYLPNIKGESTKALVRIEGRRAIRVGLLSGLISLSLFFLATYGLSAVYHFSNSPAFLRYLIPPLDDGEIIYSFGQPGEYEITYGFKEEKKEVFRKYKERLQEDGWKIAEETPISLFVTKDEVNLLVSFISVPPGKTKAAIRSKVIVLYHRTP